MRQQVKAGRPDSVYFLQGEDDVEKAALAADFADLVDEGLRAFNIERVHFGDMTSGDALAEGVAGLLDAARTLPMMSPWRVLVVLQADALLVPKRESDAASAAREELTAYLKQPEQLTVLVLVGTSLDKRTKIFKDLTRHATLVDCGAPEDVAGAERWVRAKVKAAGAEIDSASARAMAVSRGFPDRPRTDGKTGNVQRLRGDVDRLLLYTMGQKKITLDDVRQLAGPAALQDDWAMANAIEEGNSGKALRQLALMLDEGAAAEKILGQLGWLVRAKFPTIAPAELVTAVDALFRTDLDLKRSAGDPRVLLERLVVELCAGNRTRFSRT